LRPLRHQLAETIRHDAERNMRQLNHVLFLGTGLMKLPHEIKEFR
jgi:hypothetical protein